MPITLIPSFLFYCFINGISPGPANLCSLAAAMKYGKARALRQWRGLFVGFATDAMGAVFLTYFLGEVLNQYVGVLVYVGAAYLLWLAFHILTDKGDATVEAGASCGFWSGFLVQITNVKVIVFCLTALSSYVLPYTRSFWTLLGVGIFLPFTGPVANLAWLFAGASLQRLFARYRRPLNALMAASLALCAFSLVSK